MRLLSRVIPIRRCLLALALLAVQTGSQAQATETGDPVRLSLPEARTLAFALLRDGHPDHARRIALGLLKAEPDSYAASMILARAETDMGRAGAGARAGRRAWTLATGEEQHFAAAYMVSKSLTEQGKYGQAQLWLRRAGQATDSDRMEMAARRQFRRVQALNPWSTRLSFSVRPSSNINGGPTTNTFTIGDFVFVDPTAVPLSGLEFSSSAFVKRRFENAGGGPDGYLAFSLGTTRYSLTDKARQAVPTARASDFAMTKARVSGGLLFATSKHATTRVDLAVYRDWRGGAGLADNVLVSLGQDLRRKTARLGYSVSFEDRTRLDRSNRSSQSLSLGGYWAAPLPFGQVSVSATLSDIRSDAAEIAAQAARLSLRFVAKNDIFGAVPSLELTQTFRDYDRALYSATPRRDTGTAISAELFFPSIEYYGFAPTVGAVYSRNRSNVSSFDVEEYGMTFGLRSTF